jgi:hypothetical protein
LTYQVNLIKWAKIEGPWSPNLNKNGPLAGNKGNLGTGGHLLAAVYTR